MTITHTPPGHLASGVAREIAALCSTGVAGDDWPWPRTVRTNMPLGPGAKADPEVEPEQVEPEPDATEEVEVEAAPEPDDEPEPSSYRRSGK